MADELNEILALRNDRPVVEERRGRPCELRDTGAVLRAEHRRVAMMKLAGMTDFAIAQFLEVSSGRINQILHRPDVVDYMMKVDATFVNDLRPTAERVNAKLEAGSIRAQQVVEEIMEEMHAREEVKAKSLALMSARDILDRAGHRPAMKVEGKIHHGVTINPEQLDHALEVIKESNG